MGGGRGGEQKRGEEEGGKEERREKDGGVGLGKRWAFGEVRPPERSGIRPRSQLPSRDHASCVSGGGDY